MHKVAIVTHTGSDISPQEAQHLGVVLIPDIVRFGEEEYQNKFGISDEAFYERMRQEKKLPTSSQPPLSAYVKAYKQAAEAGADEIFCLMVTSKMSGCYNAAKSAIRRFSRECPTVPVTVYDTLQVSHGMSLMVREAVKLAAEGLTAEQIREQMDLLQDRIALYFMLDTLENARKGGRVGGITATIAATFGIKPLMKFTDGVCKDFTKTLSAQAAQHHLLDLIEKEADPTGELIVFHGDASEKADRFIDQVKARFPELRIRKEMVGAVIAIYAGDGSLGVAFIRKAAS